MENTAFSYPHRGLLSKFTIQALNTVNNTLNEWPRPSFSYSLTLYNDENIPGIKFTNMEPILANFVFFSIQLCKLFLEDSTIR